MKLLLLSPLLLLIRSSVGLKNTNTNCPLLGPVFPAPIAPTNLNSTTAARSEFQKILNKAIANGGTDVVPLDNLTTSFSINVFSTHDDNSLFNFQYAAPGLNGSLPAGTLNNDTVYRIGSVSKLLTVYTFLIKVGDRVLNDPVTKYVPELAAFAEATKDNFDPVNDYDWSEITVGALASQLAGLQRDWNIGDLATSGVKGGSNGLPPLAVPSIYKCGLPGQATCTRKDVLEGINATQPMAASFHTPEYSNMAFAVLSYVLQNITGEPFDQSFNSAIVEPLGLTHTGFHVPKNETNVIIPGSVSTSQWALDIGEGNPAGGAYSTLTDLTTIGRSILSSQLLKPTLTRRWLKPDTHTSSYTFSVGMPWEINRMAVPISPSTKNTRVVDLYTKSGSLGAYGALLVLDPDHDIGFAIQAAGKWGSEQVYYLAELLAETFISAVEEAAREEALINFVGTYASTDPKLNSSIIFVLDPDRPGLSVSQFFSNGTDMLKAPLFSALPTDVPQHLNIQLYPVGLSSGTEQAWRAVFEMLPKAQTGTFDLSCNTWFGVGGPLYGNVGLDDFVFGFEKNSAKASTVNPRALRTILKRVDLGTYITEGLKG